MNILTQSFWRDEAFSGLLVQRSPFDIIHLSAIDSTPPLFYLLAHFWSNFFGSSEVSLRSLTFLFFLGTALIMYRIGERLTKGAGPVFFLLTITQPFLFNYAFEVRTYSLLALLTALTVLFYLEGRFWLLALSAAALLYTHLFGALVVGLLLGWSIFRKVNFLPLMLSFISFIPWLPNYIAFAKLGPGWQVVPDLKTLLASFLSLGAPVVALALPGFRGLREKKEFFPLLTLWLAPILGIFIFSQWKPLFLDRYLIITVPAEIILAAWALRENALRPLLLIAILVQVGASGYVFTHPTKPPFRELASYLLSQEKSGDEVLNGSSLTYFESQYYGLKAKIYSPDANVPYYVGTALIPPQDVLKNLPLASRYWVIELGEPGGSLGQSFPGKLLGTSEFGSLKLSLYEPK